MKINYANNEHFRNNEHFQFHTEFKDLVVKTGAQMLEIADLFTEYLACYADEDEAIDKIRTSAFTQSIKLAHIARGNLYRSMRYAVLSGMGHFNSEVKNAARKIKIVFDTYGAIHRRSIISATAALYNFVQELEDNFSASVQTMGLADWLIHLKRSNEDVSNLVQNRFAEASAKTNLKTIITRNKVDDAYSRIISMINARLIIGNNAPCTNFARKWNVYIKRYNTNVAKRSGQARARKQKLADKNKAVEPVSEDN